VSSSLFLEEKYRQYEGQKWKKGVVGWAWAFSLTSNSTLVNFLFLAASFGIY